MTLIKGDTVIIVAPAGRVLDENIDNAITVLESWGLNILLSDCAKGEYFNFSGTQEQRLSDLQWALNYKEAKVIFAARGGYGAIQLLGELDWTLFKQYPKILVGYSDITNLHVQINDLGIMSLHALMPNSFPILGESNSSLLSLKQILFDNSYCLRWESPIATDDIIIDAEIVGGNLSILYSLQGTPYAPNYTDKILFIEDVSEYLYHIDRMLYSFHLSGIFENIKGVLVGDFTNLKDNDLPFGKNINQIILNITDKYNIPVVFGVPTGHSFPTMALPLGQIGRLCVVNNKCEFCTL